MKLSMIAGIAAAALVGAAAHAQPASHGAAAHAQPASHGPAPHAQPQRAIDGAAEDVGPEGTGAPSEATYTYSLGAGSDSGIITPPAGVPVTVMGNQTALGVRAVGQVSLLRVSNNFLEWTGLESASGTAITNGYDSNHGTHILWIDFAHQVDLEVNDANSFFIHNGSSGARTGQVTLIW